MKNLFISSCLILFVINLNAKAIVDKAPNNIQISLSDQISTLDYLLEKGEYSIEFINIPEGARIDISIVKNLLGRAKLPIPETFSKTPGPERESNGNFQLPNHITINSNTAYVITITLTLEDASKEVRTYNFKSDSSWSWSSTFGFNAIFLLRNDTYKTIPSDDKFSIVEDGGRKKLEYVPSLMFSFMDHSKNIQWGFSGGLGFDLEKISTFTGLSIGFGQNIVLTGGVALHRQRRLDSKYDNAEIVDSAIESDDLHDEYYRFNPFVSMSFRLDKSPFARP